MLSYIFDVRNKIQFKPIKVLLKENNLKKFATYSLPKESVELYIPNQLVNDDILIYDESERESDRGFQLNALVAQSISSSSDSMLKYQSTGNSGINLNFDLIAYSKTDDIKIKRIIKFFVDMSIHDDIEKPDNKKFKALKLMITSEKNILPAYIQNKDLLFYIESVSFSASPLRLAKDGTIIFRHLSLMLRIIENINKNISETIDTETPSPA